MGKPTVSDVTIILIYWYGKMEQSDDRCSGQLIGEGNFGKVIAVKSKTAGWEGQCVALKTTTTVPNLEVPLAFMNPEGITPILSFKYVANDMVLEMPLASYSLRDYLKERKLTSRDILKIFGQMVSCVYSIQRYNIAHLDIHLSNFVVRNGRVELIDFGEAIITTGEKIVDGLKGGVFQGYTEIATMVQGFKSDIWALGIALVEMLVGKRPDLRWGR
jgi:serine/threonine protein kinase